MEKIITPVTFREGKKRITQYEAVLDGELIGYYDNHHDAEVELDRLVLEQLTQGLPLALAA